MNQKCLLQTYLVNITLVLKNINNNIKRAETKLTLTIILR